MVQLNIAHLKKTLNSVSNIRIAPAKKSDQEDNSVILQQMGRGSRAKMVALAQESIKPTLETDAPDEATLKWLNGLIGLAKDISYVYGKDVKVNSTTGSHTGSTIATDIAQDIEIETTLTKHNGETQYIELAELDRKAGEIIASRNLTVEFSPSDNKLDLKLEYTDPSKARFEHSVEFDTSESVPRIISIDKPKEDADA